MSQERGGLLDQLQHLRRGLHLEGGGWLLEQVSDGVACPVECCSAAAKWCPWSLVGGPGPWPHEAAVPPQPPRLVHQAHAQPEAGWLEQQGQAQQRALPQEALAEQPREALQASGQRTS